MTLAELLALRRPADPDINMDHDAVTGEELARFGESVVDDQYHWHVCERRVDPPFDNTVEMVLAEDYFSCEGVAWYRITAWATVHAGFEWRHLYFDNAGYLYYPSGHALIAFIARAMSHIPEDER